MRIPIHSASDLGVAVRAARRASKVRLDNLAATAGVSKQFTSDVEHGKATVRLGLVLKLLSELGVRLELDIPESAGPALATLRAKQGLSPDRKSATQPSGSKQRG